MITNEELLYLLHHVETAQYTESDEYVMWYFDTHITAVVYIPAKRRWLERYMDGSEVQVTVNYIVGKYFNGLE